MFFFTFFKETKFVNAALAKASRLSSLLHTSTSFKEKFEEEFGQRGIPASVTTRWNSTLRQLKSVVSCDQLKLTRMLEDGGHKETVFTAREWMSFNLLEKPQTSHREKNL